MILGRPDWISLPILAEKVPEEEPIFLIRGQDIFSPTIITNYIHMMRQLRTGEVDEKARKEMIKQLILHRERIQNYGMKKVPDFRKD